MMQSIQKHCTEAQTKHYFFPCKHTNDAKDVADRGHEDNEQVDHEDETECDGYVSGPVERLVREQDLE